MGKGKKKGHPKRTKGDRKEMHKNKKFGKGSK